MIKNRNSLYRKMSKTFPESKLHKLNENIREGQRRRVQQISQMRFEVFSFYKNQTRIVNLEENLQLWKLLG